MLSVPSERCLIVPDRIVRRSAMVYCQGKRGVGFLHFVRMTAGKRKIRRTGQRSVLVAWTFGLKALQWPSPNLVPKAFPSHLQGKNPGNEVGRLLVLFLILVRPSHKDLLSTNCYITPLQSSTLVSRSELEMQRPHPPHPAQEKFGAVLPKLNGLKQQVFFIIR